MGATSKSRRVRWNALARKGEVSCSICPPHKFENAKKRQRDDKYKEDRKKETLIGETLPVEDKKEEDNEVLLPKPDKSR